MSTPNIAAGRVERAKHPAEYRGPHGQVFVRGVEYRRVYVWELPVRVYHWINAIALVALCVTGYLIGAPIRAFYAAEAYQQYWFGWVRFIHFTAAFWLGSTGASPATSTLAGPPFSHSKNRNSERSLK
jgi:hypothetical protein